MRIKIDCYKEKCALIAYYFCEKERVTITQKAAFEMWKSWWRDDFRRKGHPAYKITDWQLGHNKADPDKDNEHLKACNKLFQKSYSWIRDYIKKHTKAEVKDKVRRQRIKQLAELKSIAGESNMQVHMSSKADCISGGQLAQYRLVGKDIQKGGNYEVLLQYLKNMKGGVDHD